MFEQLHDILNNYEYINIYCHVNPDLDALGSSLGLKKLINLNFKNKDVRVIFQENNYPYFPKSDKINEDVLDKALAIVLDVSTSERIYDQSFSKAKVSFRIDHHPDELEFTTYKIADTKYSSTCELIAKIAYINKYKMDTQIASLLYLGMLSDTLAFKTNNTTKDTFLCAAYLMDYDIDLVYLNKYVFTSDLTTYKLETFIRNKVIIKEKFAYSIISKEELIENNTTLSNAKNCVYLYGQISSVELYAIFVEGEDNLYEASLRSFKTQINDVAHNYGGGGHQCASGIKSLTLSDINEIVETLTIRSTKE